jgi:outer membrane lipoprotein
MRCLLLLAATMLAACARPPRPIAGDFPAVQVADVQSGAHAGERVRWGGVIVETRPEQDQTCFEVVGLPLDARARPRIVDQTYGRFEACAPGFYDPEIYEPRREVTIIGAVQDVQAGKVGGYEYRFPRMAAELVYLWPDRPDPRYYPYYGAYPYWDAGPSWGFGWGVGWSGGWHDHHGGWDGGHGDWDGGGGGGGHGGAGGGPMIHQR